MSKFLKRTFVNQICRTCYHTSSNYHALTEVSTQGKTFADMLLEIAKINVKSKDLIDAPQYMCDCCAQQLKNSLVFVQRAQQVDQELLALTIGAAILGTHEDSECLLETAIEIPQTVELKREKAAASVSMCDSDDQLLTPIKRKRNNKHIEKIGTVNNDPIHLYSLPDQQVAEDQSSDVSGDDNLSSVGRGSKKKKRNSKENLNPNIEKNVQCNAGFKDMLHEMLNSKFKEMEQKIVYLNKNLIAEQSVQLNKFLRQKSDYDEIEDEFPLATEDDMWNMEHKLNRENRPRYISVVQRFFKFGVERNVTKVFGNDVLVDFNLDGTHNKKRFKDFTQLYDVVIEGIHAAEPGSDPVQSLRKAFNIIKQNSYRKKYRERSISMRTKGGLGHEQQQQSSSDSE